MSKRFIARSFQAKSVCQLRGFAWKSFFFLLRMILGLKCPFIKQPKLWKLLNNKSFSKLIMLNKTFYAEGHFQSKEYFSQGTFPKRTFTLPPHSQSFNNFPNIHKRNRSRSKARVKPPGVYFVASFPLNSHSGCFIHRIQTPVSRTGISKVNGGEDWEQFY